MRNGPPRANAESRNVEYRNAESRNEMKRAIVLITVFLLAGAIVNVAVAWGCALWVHTQNIKNEPPYFVTADEFPCWICAISRRFGSITISSYCVSIRDALYSYSQPVITNRNGVPYWCHASTPPSKPWEEPVIDNARGWPCLALRCQMIPDKVAGSVSVSYKGGYVTGPLWKTTGGIQLERGYDTTSGRPLMRSLP